MGRVFFDTRKNIVDIAAAYTVLPSDSGTTFIINQASAYEITLPLMSTIERGWNCQFILGTVAANAVTIANVVGEDTLVGNISTSEIADSATATLLATTAVDEVVFISGALLGETVNIISNGVNYFVTGSTSAADHITIS
tara:strand:- start:239 stop:658 length:420 start_codon:yes stop_codon:yes gene_type:complete